MNTVTKKYFSDLCGISKAAVTKACQAQRLGMSENGKQINLDHRITIEFLRDKGVDLKKRTAELEKQKEKPQPKSKQKPQPKKKAAKKKATPKAKKKKPAQSARKPPGPQPKTKADTEAENGYTLPDIKSLNDIDETTLFLMAKSDIDKLKSFQQAQETRIKVDKLRGDLIERNIVKLAFAKLYTVDNNELKAMEERLTPSICGIFGEMDDSKKSVRVQKLINNEVTKALRHIKRIMDEFLVTHGAKKI
jgi:hypothetical protein